MYFFFFFFLSPEGIISAEDKLVVSPFFFFAFIILISASENLLLLLLLFNLFVKLRRMPYDPSPFVAPGRSVSDLLDYSDDDEYVGDCSQRAGKGYVELKTDKHGAPIVMLERGGSNSVGTTTAASANPQAMPTSLSKFQPAQHKHVNSSVLRRIHLEKVSLGGNGKVDQAPPWGVDYSGGGGASGAKATNHKVVTEMCEATLHPRASKRTGGPKEVDRSERATVENVMDPRTRLLLYKLVNNNFLREIHGCVSTGKEANVYYAVCGDGSAAAVKVYKTSILAFKDRDKYVSGEFRFQRYCKSNPRKMVRTWAEKEARNLSRLRQGGVQAPAVKLLRQHILLMDFIGEDGWPALRLKDVVFRSLTVLDRYYLELCCIIRNMFMRCRLIHGDLSEYNLLLHQKHLVVIDVSQSVEHDHPYGMDFLRRDLMNVNTFFRSKGQRELFRLQDFFYFVTTPNLPPLSSASGLHALHPPSNSSSSSLPFTVNAVTTGEAGGAGVPKTVKEITGEVTVGTELLEMIQYLREWRAQLPQPSQGKEGTEVNSQEEGGASMEEKERKEQQAKVDEQVFLHINVPRALAEFSDVKPPNPELAVFMEQMISRDMKKRDDENDEEEGKAKEGQEGHTNTRKSNVGHPHTDPTDRNPLPPRDGPTQRSLPISPAEMVMEDSPPVGDPHSGHKAMPFPSACEKDEEKSRWNQEEKDVANGPFSSASADSSVWKEKSGRPLDRNEIIVNCPDSSLSPRCHLMAPDDCNKKEIMQQKRVTFGELKDDGELGFNREKAAGSSWEEGDASDEEEDENDIQGEEKEKDSMTAEKTRPVKPSALTIANMTREERRVHKKMVKEAQRERREEKKKNKGKKQKKTKK